MQYQDLVCTPLCPNFFANISKKQEKWLWQSVPQNWAGWRSHDFPAAGMGTMESPPKLLWPALPQEHHGPVLAFQCTSVSAIITLISAHGAEIPGLPLMFRPAQLDSTLCIGCQNGSKSPWQAVEGINRNCSLKFACLMVCSSTGCREEMNQMLN